MSMERVHLPEAEASGEGANNRSGEASVSAIGYPLAVELNGRVAGTGSSGLVGVGGVCPKCLGVSQHPEMEGCLGCFDCDFFGTLEGFETMQRMMVEGYEAHAAYIRAGVCSQCGACSLAQAEKMCRPSPLADTGDYTCDGEALWEDERDSESEVGGGGAEPVRETAASEPPRDNKHICN